MRFSSRYIWKLGVFKIWLSSFILHQHGVIQGSLLRDEIDKNDEVGDIVRVTKFYDMLPLIRSIELWDWLCLVVNGVNRFVLARVASVPIIAIKGAFYN